MEICILGLPQTGKTTVFNNLTGGRSEAVLLSSSHFATNIGIARLPDSRIPFLQGIYHPKKTVYTDIKYTDIAGVQKSSVKGEGIYGPFLNYLSSADAIMHVVRAFENPAVPHSEGSVDPQRDIVNMYLELVISDIVILEHRLDRIEIGLKSAKPDERDQLHKEQQLLGRIKASLEKETPIWKQGLTKEEMLSISSYQFLTAKPMLIVLNIGEEQIGKIDQIEKQYRSIYQSENFDVIALCGKLEYELAQLNEAEAAEFRKSLGITDSSINRILSKSFSLLGLISFYTTVSNELKAWTLTENTPAIKAAGKIHSDIEKGFIKAEVISYSDLQKYPDLADIKRHGLQKIEGRNYPVKDGDIITFLFNK